MSSMSSPAHGAAAISAVAATASVAGWMSEHAVLFTIAAAVAAVLSGCAAFAFYCVSIYYKIKYNQK